MPRIGRYEVPFPFTPYPLQVHAVTALRDFLQTCTATPGDTPPANAAVVVLESPTGTGKSHMLLSGTLSFFYNPIDPAPAPDDASPPPLKQPRLDALQTAAETAPPSSKASSSPTLEEMVRQRQEAHVMEELQAARKRRLRQERRRLRLAKWLQQQQQQHQLLLLSSSSSSAHGSPTAAEDECAAGDNDYLVDQDPLAVLQEMWQADPSSTGPAIDMNKFISSSSSSSSSSSASKEDEADGVSATETSLSTLVPLRRPKVYVASRTHAQLQQLMEDFQRSSFGSELVVPSPLARESHSTRAEPECPSPAATTAPRRLRAVHIAGRQQLCINASVRRRANKSAEELNEACLEAMRFEYSKEGRAARRRRDKQRAAGISVGGAVLRDLEDLDRAGPLEDDAAADDKGCLYCATRRLRALLTHVQAEANDTGGGGSRSLARMLALGREMKACPFIASRLLLRGADVVLIPYGYLADPQLRETLLGGAATNPATKAEADAEDLAVHASGPTAAATAGAVLRRQPHTRRGAQAELSEDDAVQAAAASEAPPRFDGDLVVIDEAHNIADHCRAVSTAAVTLPELRLAQGLLQRYLERYESRLLTTNKQRLRELIFFLNKVAAYLVRAGGSCEAREPAARQVAAQVQNFDAFTFAAAVDFIDLQPLLSFLTRSRLVHKIGGLVASILRRENDAAAHAADVSAAHARRPRSGAPRAADVPATAPTLHQWLSATHAASSAPQDVAGHPDPPPPPPSLSTEACVSIATRALRRTEGILRWFERSDDTTRVVLGGASEDALAPPSPHLKLVQLEPGRHTLYPLLRSARATVLAGGTMQPLELTCAPLLPPSAPPVHTISEGHIVPSSSVAVWALGCGPSGKRLLFARSALTSDESSPRDRTRSGSHTSNQAAEPVAPGELATFTELASTLLNLARVLPPAGVICFFTSHAMEERFVRFLRSTTYFESIDSVKRIFLERGADGSASADTTLAEYSSWIYNSTNSSGTTPAATRGALLFAVMGGRLSEGINFADDLGRAVLVVGLPYANYTQAELQLTLQHAAARSADPRQEWRLYNDMCMRTVNQCIGRCIRHARDYAAVVLIDARFVERAEVRHGVASWLQPSLRTANGFGDCFRGLREFFAARHAPPVAPPADANS